MNLRRIEPLPVLARDLPPRDLGRAPEMRWVAPTSLLVDESYQRDHMGRRSIRLIADLVSGFAWRKMKPPIVVVVGADLHCVDGQHTAVAAATLGIKKIPVFVVDAPTVQDRADAFVAHNRDRIVMGIFDLYRARLAGGDPDALDADKVCQRAGVRLRNIQPGSKVMIGDTTCVGTIIRLVKRRGAVKARQVLEALVKGERGGFGPGEIDGVEAVMCMVRPQTTVEEMAAAVKALGQHGVLTARMQSTAEKRPQKHILRDVYLDLLRKQTQEAPRARAS